MDTTKSKSSLIAEDMPVLTQADVEESDGVINVPRRNSLLATDVWSEPVAPRAKKSKKIKMIITYTAVGLISFFIFLYLSFPFNVVKEVLVGKINDNFVEMQSPMRISVKRLKYKFPIGVNLEEVQLNNVTEPSATLNLSRVSASLSLFSVLLGNAASEVRLEQPKGFLEIETSHSIRSLAALSNSRIFMLPTGDVDVEFSRFDLKPLAASALAYVRSGNNPALQTIQPFLRTEFSGLLSGKIKFSIPSNYDSFDKVVSNVNLSIEKGAYFEMKDETLAIPRQTFTEAKISAKLAQKVLKIDPATKFIANDLGINLSGQMTISDRLDVNDVKLNLGLTLKGKIEENFKNLLPIILGCDMSKMVNGVMNVELSGTFSALTCS